MLRRQHCEHINSKKNLYVCPDSSKINGCKKRNVLFMLFQLLLSLLLLLRVLLWRYAFSCSSAHVVFVVAVILISDVWSILAKTDCTVSCMTTTIFFTLR